MLEVFEADAGILCGNGIGGQFFVLERYLLLYVLVLKAPQESRPYLQSFMQPPESGQTLL